MTLMEHYDHKTSDTFLLAHIHIQQSTSSQKQHIGLRSSSRNSLKNSNQHPIPGHFQKHIIPGPIPIPSRYSHFLVASPVLVPITGSQASSLLARSWAMASSRCSSWWRIFPWGFSHGKFRVSGELSRKKHENNHPKIVVCDFSLWLGTSRTVEK